MEREIKFRGKISGSEWVYGYLYEDETGVYIKEPSKNKRFGTGYEVVKESVGQYTGLKDKNGNPIYEDDVLKSVSGGVYQVGFDDGKFEIHKPGDKEWKPANQGLFHYRSDIDLLIIGNIYENKDLLPS